VASALRAPEEAAAIDGALTWLAADASRSLITLADADYPALLLQLSDPPPLLYLHGRRELLASLRWRSSAVAARADRAKPTPRRSRLILPDAA